MAYLANQVLSMDKDSRLTPNDTFVCRLNSPLRSVAYSLGSSLTKVFLGPAEQHLEFVRLAKGRSSKLLEDEFRHLKKQNYLLYGLIRNISTVGVLHLII